MEDHDNHEEYQLFRSSAGFDSFVSLLQKGLPLVMDNKSERSMTPYEWKQFVAGLQNVNGRLSTPPSRRRRFMTLPFYGVFLSSKVNSD